jgi:hypothetical protein
MPGVSPRGKSVRSWLALRTGPSERHGSGGDGRSGKESADLGQREAE